MSAPIYGTPLYGDVSSIYSRIGAALAAAQAKSVRETGLQVSVVEEQVNGWAVLAGTPTYPTGVGWGLYRPANAGKHMVSLEYWSYRGGCDMIALGNGNIIRIRVGDPANVNDRQLWYQTITDPFNIPQWASWSVLYSGTHIGRSLEDDGAGGYNVFHTKLDGKLYRNNSVVWDPAADGWTGYKALSYSPVLGKTNAGFVRCLATHGVDGDRKIEIFWTPDVTDSSSFVYDGFNNSWQAWNVLGVYLDDEQGNHFVHRLQGAPWQFDNRQYFHGTAVQYCRQAFDDEPYTIDLPQTLWGTGGGAGPNYLGFNHVVQLSDGYYYGTGNEVHEDKSLGVATSLGYGLPVWFRSKDLKHWTDPVVGPFQSMAWGTSGLVERSGFVFWTEAEVVWYRPIGTLEHDISDYVPEVHFELPRDNQAGTGTLKIANPDGINDAIRALSDREIVIKPGMKVADGSYEFLAFDRFWIKQCQAEVKGADNRLNLTFGNVWDRLTTDFRNPINFIGQMQWDDWSPDKRNKAFNYYFLADSAPVESSSGLTTRGICLFTGWKGYNPDVTVHFGGLHGNPRIIFRYVDTRNYMYLESVGGVVSIHALVDGAVKTSASFDSLVFTADSTPTIRLRVRWNFIQIWFNGVFAFAGNQFDSDDEPWIKKPGYVGFSSSSGSYKVSDFHLEDFEAPLTTEDMIRTALALADIHDVDAGGATSRVYALTWGPQTDAATIADALLQALETDKLQLIWRNGRIQVGKFNEQTPIRTIMNEVIDSDQVDEANRRINLAVVDGNEDSWIEVDTADLAQRGRNIVGYQDVPELLDKDAVIERARESIRAGAQGSSPGGTTPLFFDLWRMDAVQWIDNEGNSNIVRIEGFQVDIKQDMQPSQHQIFDTSVYSAGSTGNLSQDGSDPENG